MPDREKVIKAVDSCFDYWLDQHRYLHPLELETVRQRKAEALAMLKEQEAVKPVLDEKTGRIWLCGKCGSYVGFEDHDENDPNEFDKYCRECGRPVLWEGR